MGLTEEQYRELQKLGNFDTKTSSWVKTPSDSRNQTGSLVQMTSEEFHELVEEYGEPVPEAGGDRPLTLARIAEMERERGIKFPAFYKEFLSRYGAGYIRDVLVLSPDSKSEFKFWETSGRVENRECNFMGVMEYESDYYGFLIEQGVCSNDIWHADHEFGYEIADSDYTDFFDLLAKLGLGFWDEEDGDQ